jgi:hypothetical protein
MSQWIIGHTADGTPWSNAVARVDLEGADSFGHQERATLNLPLNGKKLHGECPDGDFDIEGCRKWLVGALLAGNGLIHGNDPSSNVWLEPYP